MDRIYGIPTADTAWDDLNPQPPQSVLIATNATESAYLVGSGGFSGWDALVSAYIIGSWDHVTGLQEGQSYDIDGITVIGAPAHPVTADYEEWVRPLGNESGRATGLLDSPRWQGHAEQKFLQDDQRYKDTNAPFTLKITRVEHVAPDPFPGWGWSVEMLSEDPLRDITARAVGIYSDPECTAYLYTTGAFVQDGSHNNNYYTECPTGQRTVTPDQVNFALLLGSIQEGFFNLPEGSDTTEALFWTKDQGAADEWAAGISYAVNDEVSYLGVNYICLQAHTSQVGWEPPNVPALWSAV